MRVVVTGAAGFVGSHLTRLLLREGCEVTALVRPNGDRRRLADVADGLTVVEADLLSPSSLRDALAGARPELCFHLAWFIQPGVHPGSTKNIALVGASMELLSILDALGCARTIITGTYLEQDPSFGRLSEATPVKPQNFYSACKHALHVMAEAFQARQKRGFAWARLFNIYGPGEYTGPLVPDVITKLLAGESCALTDGTQERDYLYVEDVAAALAAIGRSSLDGAFNVGSGEAVSVRTMASRIGALIGRGELLRFGARQPSPFDCKFCVADATRLRDLGWAPRVHLDDGLAQTIQYWRSELARA